MRIYYCFIILNIFFCNLIFGQQQKLNIKVLNELLEPIKQVTVFAGDTIFLTSFNKNGEFEIEINKKVNSLIITAINCDPKFIDFEDSCKLLELILQSNLLYNSFSKVGIDEFRSKEFQKIPILHRIAYENGILKYNKPCYIDKFISYVELIKQFDRYRRKKPSS
jgi:hypothetical protein